MLFKARKPRTKRLSFSRFSLFCLSASISFPVAANAVETSISSVTHLRHTPSSHTFVTHLLPSRKLCDLQDERISESSGLGASRRYPDFLWTQNDSGSEPRVFLISRAGQTVAVVHLEGAKIEDWEELTISGTGRNAWVYVGDIGDNARKRANLVIYRFQEPPFNPAQTAELNVPSESMTLTYPNGPHDAEVLLVTPQGHLIVVTKTVGQSEIFITPRPFARNSSQTLIPIGKYPFGGGDSGDGSLASLLQTALNRLTTGGDISSDGKRIVIRTYGLAYEWMLPANGSWREVWKGTPQVWKLPETRQGEAICRAKPSVLVWTTSISSPPAREIRRRYVNSPRLSDEQQGAADYQCHSRSHFPRQCFV